MKDILHTVDVNRRSGTDLADHEPCLSRNRGGDALFVRLRIPDCQILVDRILVATVSGEICLGILIDRTFQSKERRNRGTYGPLVQITSKQVSQFGFNVFYDPLRVFTVVLIEKFIIVSHHSIQFFGTGKDFAFDVVVAMVGRCERLYVTILFALV